jgi:hypothetical protein
MRRLMTLGLISTAALMTACSDDESSGGNGGSGTTNGGSAGNSNGGSSGATNGGSGGSSNGGASGATNGGSGGGSNGGSGGSGSDPDAGDGGGEPPCTSCVELRVPVTAVNQTTLFQFALGAPLDMSTAIITYRMRALTIDNQLGGSPFAQDADYGGFQQRFINLDTGNGFTSPDIWVNITHDMNSVPAAPIIFVDIPDGGDASDGGGGTPTADPAAFDKSRVIQFGVNVGSVSLFTGFPATVTVLLDSVTFEGIDRPDVTFDDSAEGFAANGGQAGSQVLHHPAP